MKLFINREIMLGPGDVRLPFLGIAICLFSRASTGLWAAEQAAVDAAIQRGRTHLVQQIKPGVAGNLGLYALVKLGFDKQDSAVQRAVKTIEERIVDGSYSPLQHHFYEAGIALMLLEAISGETHRHLMEPIVAFVIANQRPNGAWFYPTVVLPDSGDTSITQYSLLGLWAAVRAGIEIPNQVWENAARWHITRQASDGAFRYHPFVGGESGFVNVSNRTMTVAGTGSLMLSRRMLFGDVEFVGETRVPESGRRFGVLDRMTEDVPATSRKTELPILPAIDGSLKKSLHWLAINIGGQDARSENYPCYYRYGIERVGSLHGVEKIGVHDWYDEGADELLRRQRGDGSWIEVNGDAVASTALALLFLMKVTASTISPVRKTPTFGGGLLAGGRGLPANLGQISVKEGVVAERKMRGPVDSLLLDLERSSPVEVASIQAAVVEAVQLERTEDLFQHVEKLKKLAFDSRVEVRRTACWALGRAGEITAAPMLIQALTDADESVAREASFGLSILSRRINGCGLPLDPLDNLAEDASDADRQSHLELWGNESAKRWQEWYQKNRPYEERDDRTQLKRK
jgi:hypothetical protein